MVFPPQLVHNLVTQGAEILNFRRLCGWLCTHVVTIPLHVPFILLQEPLINTEQNTMLDILAVLSLLSLFHLRLERGMSTFRLVRPKVFSFFLVFRLFGVWFYVLNMKFKNSRERKVLWVTNFTWISWIQSWPENGWEPRSDRVNLWVYSAVWHEFFEVFNFSFVSS